MAELASATLTDPWSERGFALALADARTRVRLAHSRDGRLVGLAVARDLSGEAELLVLAVAPAWRRRGVGRALTEAVCDACGRGPLGPGPVHLEVRESDRAARAFYERLGFVVAGRRPRYYHGGEGAVLMSRTSAPPAAAPGSGRPPERHRERGLTGSATRATGPLRAEAPILENRDEGGGNRRLRLAVPGWPGAAPGQFAMLSAGALTGVDRSDPLLPRPMAVFRQRDGADAPEVEILYKVVGRGTGLLAEALPGQRLRVVGPLGRPFPEPDADERPVLVGGGTGIASLYELAARAAGRCRVRVLLGGRRAADLMGLRDFEALGVEVAVTTEDGSRGRRGLVTEPLGAFCEPGGRVYACGPTPMMQRCAEIAGERGSRCWVSLENTMACGFGVCLGCAAPRSSGGYALVCREGPVFEAPSVAWDGLP